VHDNATVAGHGVLRRVSPCLLSVHMNELGECPGKARSGWGSPRAHSESLPFDERVRRPAAAL